MAGAGRAQLAYAGTIQRADTGTVQIAVVRMVQRADTGMVQLGADAEDVWLAGSGKIQMIEDGGVQCTSRGYVLLACFSFTH